MSVISHLLLLLLRLISSCQIFLYCKGDFSGIPWRKCSCSADMWYRYCINPGFVSFTLTPNSKMFFYSSNQIITRSDLGLFYLKSSFPLEKCKLGAPEMALFSGRTVNCDSCCINAASGLWPPITHKFTEFHPGCAACTDLLCCEHAKFRI